MGQRNQHYYGPDRRSMYQACLDLQELQQCIPLGVLSFNWRADEGSYKDIPPEQEAAAWRWIAVCLAGTPELRQTLANLRPAEADLMANSMQQSILPFIPDKREKVEYLAEQMLHKGRDLWKIDNKMGRFFEQCQGPASDDDLSDTV